MSKYKEGNLARDFSDILDNIQGSFDLRLKSLGQTIGETHQNLNNFKKERQNMGEDLRDFLKKYREDLKDANFDRLKDFKGFFAELSQKNKEAAKDLHRLLKKYNLDRLGDFMQFIKPIQNQIQGMHNSFVNFAEQMQTTRSKPFGAQIRPFSSMRAVASRKEENPEVKSGQSFKVNKVKPKTSHKGKKKGKK
jgi:hypothetical protein